MSFTLTSPVFTDGGIMPGQYTCDGPDISPPLAWSGAPDGTKAYTLIVDDPDAPDPAAPQMTWVHWLLFNMPLATQGLDENVKTLPPGTREGTTDFGRTGWGGPCPPIGVHRYYFKLYALDAPLEIAGTPDKPQLLKAMEGHILGQATLMGTYKRPK